MDADSHAWRVGRAHIPERRGFVVLGWHVLTSVAYWYVYVTVLGATWFVVVPRRETAP